jgi:hypothetical protein
VYYINIFRNNGQNIGCSFKFLLKVGVEESIVNAPRMTDHESAV